MKNGFDLEVRTTKFAKEVINMCKNLPRNSMNERLIGQLVGSSGSIGANYREANDALGKKDFVMRMRIARRETKEAHHWLDLVMEANETKKDDVKPLLEDFAGQIKPCHTRESGYPEIYRSWIPACAGMT